MRPFRIVSPNLPSRSCRLSSQATRAYRASPFRPPTQKRHHRQFPTRPTRQLKESALDPVSFLIAIGVGFTAAYIADSYYSSPPPEKASVPETPAPSSTSETDADTDMAPTALPGRPGSLTPDQEEKLRELWIATLDVFGVISGGRQSLETTAAASTHAPADTKKKSKLSMFSRKNKDADHSAENTDDENDKHGQAKEFRQAIQNQSPESLRTAFWGMVKHDDPDALLLRFLRARKWDVQAALVMMISTLHWRSQEMHVDDDIVYKGEGGAVIDAKSASDATAKKDAEDFLTQLRMGKSFLHGVDAEGRPVCVVRARLHRAGEQTEKSLERFTVYTIDTARMMLRPPIDTATIIFDMTGFSMSNMDYTPVKFMIKCFEANYPESLGSVLVYKAPWVFQGIWKIIRGWLDPVVASKINFCSNVEELSAFIPKSQISKELGGDENYEYHYVEPREGENDKMKDTATRDRIEAERKELVHKYQTETVHWAKGENKGENRAALRQDLLQNYWQLDPYVRARTLYDRIGVIGHAGKMDFYPTPVSTSSADLD
ncbi:CRAL/TRIO domain-containing protein [Aureobasidium pullulans]|uniref:CRAL/TRIO domain-containing protein n=1 Tax=Aureobasidium pullulans TaxID=5580 RepID=A0A4S9MK96_AURPU|nr:CRAL/TRIO domain-containing protein [Aureobasidium pullulans]THX62575.1 CRAL/TRIO domain-containing protein [Aureobasidium pullulans]THX73212.1 CRAL/TRIO domain-containing protein [Aureobasidium pullulans]THY43568.1 CRAL/TRIO domain-containing protein [Aureobasidium pullulans]